MKEYQWIEEFIDIKKLSLEIYERAQNIEIKGLPIRPIGLLIREVVEQIQTAIVFETMGEDCRRARLKFLKEEQE